MSLFPHLCAITSPEERRSYTASGSCWFFGSHVAAANRRYAWSVMCIGPALLPTSYVQNQDTKYAVSKTRGDGSSLTPLDYLR